jgi:putative transposase
MRRCSPRSKLGWAARNVTCWNCCRSTPPACGPTSTLPALARRATQGAQSNYKNYADEPDDHAIGRSRGGLTTKIHALSDQSCSPVTVVLSAGQAGDNPMLWPLLDARRSASTDRFRLLGDKAYSHDSTRRGLRQRKIAHTIPERSDQIARRKAKGRNGGRPPAFSGRIYRHRNTIERSFNRLKHWRAIATRYDKYALTYLGGVTLAAIITHHRVRN